MDNKDFNSNTMELNSILEEAKKSRMNSSSDNKPQTNLKETERATADLGDNFVIIDDENEYTDITNATVNSNSKKEKSKKGNKKKKMITLGIIGGVVLVVLLAGVCWYILSGSNNFASNIYVNGISIGGMSKDEAKKVLAAEEAKLADAIAIDVTAGEKTVKLTKGDFKYTFNTDKILDDALEYSKEKGLKTGEKSYTIEMTFDQTSCNIASEKVSKEVDTKAENAKVTKYDSSKDDMTIEEGKTGISVKKDELTKDLQNFTKDGKVSGKLKAAAEEVKPKYTKEYLQKNIKKLSSFTTESTNDENGNSNMRVSLAACNNSIINPDDVWSFNSCTGDSNSPDNGYKPAGVIVEGKHTTGYGGGICQSSTTIYNAAMLCGMDVVERSCHYYKSTYVDAGRDATVDYGNLDLKIKNVFDYQLMMKCYMDGVTLHCEMYGLPNDEFDDIEITSSITSTFSNGFRAQTTRTFYKDKKEVRSEALPNSTYYTSAPGGDDDDSSSGGGGDESSSSSSKPEPKPDPEPTKAPEPPTQAPTSPPEPPTSAPEPVTTAE